jgi:hypothetical protein
VIAEDVAKTVLIFVKVSVTCWRVVVVVLRAIWVTVTETAFGVRVVEGVMVLNSYALKVRVRAYEVVLSLPAFEDVPRPVRHAEMIFVVSATAVEAVASSATTDENFIVSRCSNKKSTINGAGRRRHSSRKESAHYISLILPRLVVIFRTCDSDRCAGQGTGSPQLVQGDATIRRLDRIGHSPTRCRRRSAVAHRNIDVAGQPRSGLGLTAARSA